MSFQMTHMQIAYNLLEGLGITEAKEEFILGSVAPDSVHFRDDYSIEQKVHTHLFEGCGPWGDTKDYDKWRIHMEEFKSKYVENEIDIGRRMFCLGIYVHCITDYCNDLYIWRDQQKKHIPPMTPENFREEFYKEAPAVDKWLFQNSSDSENISSLFRNSREISIDGYIHAEDLVKLKDHLLNVQYNIDEQIDVSGFKYYPSDKILWFTDMVTDKILRSYQI